MDLSTEIFKSQYPFNLLTDAEFQDIFNNAEIVTFETNEFILHEDQDEETVEIHFLLSGLAKNIMHRLNGQQLSVRFYYPGDLIGVMILLTSGEMKFSVQALEPIKTLKFDKAKFFKVMGENSHFSKVVVDEISNLMKSLYNEIIYKSSSADDDEKELFKKRADTFMEPPIFISPEVSIVEAARMLQTKKVEALIVSNDEKTLEGMVGYSEILKAYFENDHARPVRDYIVEAPFVIADQSFIYDALGYLKYHPTELIPVMHKDTVAGVLRQSSFFEIKNSVYFDLTYRISNATDLEVLKALSPVNNDRFQQFVYNLLKEDMYAFDITELISNYNERLHKQIIEIAEAEMVKEGYGLPPVNYCFIAMGSLGRKEQAFSTDQDNGLILANYAHLPHANKVEEYFRLLAEKVNRMLDECGFPYCTGNIMAKNDKWRKSLDDWYDSVKQWIEIMDAEEIRDFTIFVDFRPIFGDFSLAYELRKYVVSKIQRSFKLQQLLMKDTLRFRVPIQPFGRITGAGKKRILNLKKSSIMQIVNAIRIYSIKYGVEDVNTVKRLGVLTEHERFHPRDAENAKLALHRLLTFRLTENLKQLRENEKLSSELHLGQLSRDEKKMLRDALMIAKRLQQVLELSYNRNRVV
ncbi:DUF294 nucleotidyltransferase-like domain-containing protein [Thalassobacillus pellis]|uniref:DUF294 nucleotidyltransferase-like domain-containing protein n=1 Tax=Thalassobacillus pellis TaxID=748008 RepID=UPI001960B9E1|nr:DUF294 nucleotidyltransferase-like domain-containing protein [Thalassobacillus pellis]MBM7552351.1 CBS domain-containing protein [Thalassobacillus pellis]